MRKSLNKIDRAGGEQKLDTKVKSHIEFLHSRLKVVVDSKIVRKIFSACFFALTALIQHNGLTSMKDPD